LVPARIEAFDIATFTATWTAAVPLDSAIVLSTPGYTSAASVLVEEHESLPADPPPGHPGPASTTRLVYANYFDL
jgi:hypothetical protein